MNMEKYPMEKRKYMTALLDGHSYPVPGYEDTDINLYMAYDGSIVVEIISETPVYPITAVHRSNSPDDGYACDADDCDATLYIIAHIYIGADGRCYFDSYASIYAEEYVPDQSKMERHLSEEFHRCSARFTVREAVEELVNFIDEAHDYIESHPPSEDDCWY